MALGRTRMRRSSGLLDTSGTRRDSGGRPTHGTVRCSYLRTQAKPSVVDLDLGQRLLQIIDSIVRDLGPF